MFNVTFFDSGKPEHNIPYTCVQFSGGELQVRVDYNSTVPQLVFNDIFATITADMIEPKHPMELILLVDALRRQFQGIKLRLRLKYLPYARQDRVCAPGEALSLRVFSDLINNLNFESVEVWDCHSDVGLAVLNNVINIGQEHFVNKLKTKWSWTSPYLVAPDSGALKKTMKSAKLLQWPMVRADKTRDATTGDITGSIVYSEHIGDRDFLMVDDLSDGGRSFTELAKVLRPLTNGKIYLYVTHGIFSKGIDVLTSNGIDHIYCANPFPAVDLTNSHLTIVR